MPLIDFNDLSLSPEEEADFHKDAAALEADRLAIVEAQAWINLCRDVALKEIVRRRELAKTQTSGDAIEHECSNRQTPASGQNSGISIDRDRDA